MLDKADEALDGTKAATDKFCLSAVLAVAESSLALGCSVGVDSCGIDDIYSEVSTVSAGGIASPCSISVIN